MFAPDAARIIRRDGPRETRKEQIFWADTRAKHERRIRDRYRMETELALQRALAAAASRRGFERNSSGPDAAVSSDSGTATTAAGVMENHRVQAEAASKGFALRTAETGSAIIKKAEKVFSSIDRAVDALVQPAQTSREAEGRHDSGAMFLLLLLALFLVPSFAFALLLLSVIHLRNGHRLQAGVFGAVGGAVLLMVFAAVQDMRGAKNGTTQVDSARWRAECKESAVRLTGFVYEPMPEGMIMSSVSGASADEHGCALVLTSKTAGRSGEKRELLVYPVGMRKAPNAIGLVRPMPAYAESLDQAVAWRADEEKASSQWWWRRILRSIGEA